MKITRKTKIILLSILLGTCALFIFLPIFIKSYINNNGQKLTGRTISLEGLYHNPLTGYTRLNGFQMMEQYDSAVFVSFDTLIINLDMYKMFARTLSVSTIRLVNPQIQVNKLDTAFNYTDLAIRFADEYNETPESEEDPSLNIELKNITLAQGVLQFSNLVTKREWLFDDIDISIPGLYFDNQNTNVDLDLALRDGGELLSNTEYNNQLGSYKINLQLATINLSPLQTFMKEHLDISDFGGTMNAALEISGEVGDLDKLSLKGEIDVNDYYFSDPKGHRFLSGDKVSTIIEDIVPLKQSVSIESIHIENPVFFYEMYVDSTDNIRPLLLEPDKGSESSNQPVADDFSSTETDSTQSDNLDLLIKEIKVINGQFDFQDHNPESPFEYQFSNIAVDIANVSQVDTTKLNMTAVAPDDGKVSFYWEGNFFDLTQQSFTMKTNIPGLPAFSPYTISFFDVPIEKGSFNYTSTNHINQGNLEGLHTILASDITLGEKSGFESLYDLPLKIGLYLLEDKEGNIHLEIPIEGTTNDPEFRYSKIVVNAIINGIVKLVTSPISLIGKLVGAGDDLDELSYDPVNLEITPELETKLNYLADALIQKPQLRITMIQHFDQVYAGNELATYLVKQDYYKNSHGNTSVNDYYAVKRIDLKDDKFAKYMESKAEGASKNEESLARACYDLKQKQVESTLDTLPDAWNNLITHYLTTKGIPFSNIEIEKKPDDKGNFHYELEAEFLENRGEMQADSSATTKN